MVYLVISGHKKSICLSCSHPLLLRALVCLPFFISDPHDFLYLPDGGLFVVFYALMNDDSRTKRKERVQKTSMEGKGDLHRRLFVMRVKISTSIHCCTISAIARKTKHNRYLGKKPPVADYAAATLNSRRGAPLCNVGADTPDQKLRPQPDVSCPFRIHAKPLSHRSGIAFRSLPVLSFIPYLGALLHVLRFRRLPYCCLYSQTLVGS